MRFLPITGKPSTVELAQLAAQADHVVGRVTIELKVPYEQSLASGTKWKYVRLPSRPITIDVRTTSELWEFFRGFKWLLEHKTSWKSYLKEDKP